VCNNGFSEEILRIIMDFPGSLPASDNVFSYESLRKTTSPGPVLDTSRALAELPFRSGTLLCVPIHSRSVSPGAPSIVLGVASLCWRRAGGGGEFFTVCCWFCSAASRARMCKDLDEDGPEV